MISVLWLNINAMPDTSKVEVLFYKASSGAIFCLQGVGATLQIRLVDLFVRRLTCMAIEKFAAKVQQNFRCLCISNYKFLFRTLITVKKS